MILQEVAAALLLLLVSTAAEAALYRCVDADGNRVFAPLPTKGLTNCVTVGEEEASESKRKAAPTLQAKTVADTVLTTAGYLAGAADGCKVVPEESNALSSGIALAISRGNYGAPAEAHVLLNTARQQGIADAAARKVDCTKIADMVRKTVHSLSK